jgi:hypothetical protein
MKAAGVPGTTCCALGPDERPVEWVESAQTARNGHRRTVAPSGIAPELDIDFVVHGTGGSPKLGAPRRASSS